MIKQVVVGTVAFFMVVTGFYFLYPAWSQSTNTILGLDNQLITNPVWLANIQQESLYLDKIMGYLFITLGLCIWIWLLVFAWKQNPADPLRFYEDVA